MRPPVRGLHTSVGVGLGLGLCLCLSLGLLLLLTLDLRITTRATVLTRQQCVRVRDLRFEGNTFWRCIFLLSLRSGCGAPEVMALHK